MALKIIIFTLISFFHDLFTVIWMGGLVVTVISYLPALTDSLGAGPQVKKIMLAFQKRQSKWVYISIVGLIITGILMSKRAPQFEQLFGFGNAYSVTLSIKHFLVIFMVLITLYRSLLLGKPDAVPTPKKEKLSFMLVMINAIVAVGVLFASALLVALA